MPVSDPAALQARLDELFAPQNRGDAPGLTVAVARQGRMLYRRGFGLASIEHGVANRPATRMRIGSTTKQFTCLSVLLLAEEGRLDLDADVRAVLPEMPRFTAPLTARQLMQHSSGLRCHLDLWMLATGSKARLPDGEPYAQLLRLRELNFAPGERMIYCNGGYVVLAQLIERLSGLSLGAFFERRIFKPLRMLDTELLPRDGQLLPGCAGLHVRAGDGYVRGQIPLPMSGDGGLVSTVDDLLIWLRHMDAPVIGSARSWAAMRAPTRFTGGTEGDYGLGLIRRPYRGVTLLGHAGAVIGGLAECVKVPEHGLDIALLANRSDVPTAELVKRIVDLVLGERLAPPPPRATVAGSAAFEGLYCHAYSGQLLGVVASGEHLAADFAGLKLPLWQRGDDLVAAGSVGDVVFRRPAGAADAPGDLDVIECGIAQRFRRLGAAPDALSAGAAALAGRYRSAELPAEAEIFEVDGRWLLGVQARHGRTLYAMTPLDVDLWSIALADGSLPYRQLLTVARDGAQVSGLQLSSLRTRRLAFARVGADAAPCLGRGWLEGFTFAPA
ncbi:serine hydrolase domain-containing protein [Solimonas flava]|uniref:serine hydrolase domain-containing protein n=1 Tax=Solimonas flava TaxID=415849 RepID=UPI000687F316|nr:serine hydrolase domain-containing protein [Solimonas flava]